VAIPLVSGTPERSHPIRFEGPNTIPFNAAVNYRGEVLIAGMKTQKLSAFQRDKINTLRLIRRGDIYHFVCNSIPEADFKLPERMDFDRLLLGFSAGPGGISLGKLHSVRVAAIGELPTAKPFPGRLISHDFWTVELGKVPDNYKATSINVQSTAEARLGIWTQPGLELSGDKTGSVEIPLDPRGAFTLNCEFVTRATNTLTLFLLPADKGKRLAIQVEQSKMTVMTYPPADIAKAMRPAGEINRLTIERGIKNYKIVLNESEIGQFPITVAPSSFEKLQIGLLYKDNFGLGANVGLGWRIVAISAAMPDPAKSKDVPKKP